MVLRPTYAELQQKVTELEKENRKLQHINTSLRGNAQMFKALLSTSEEIFTVVDKEGQILFINDTATRRLGRPADELIGMCVWDFFSQDVVELRKSYSAKALRMGRPLRFEDQRDGIHYDNIFYPIVDADGSASRTVIIARDITLSKKIEQELRESEEKYRLLFDNEKDAILLIDTATTRLIDMNKAAVHQY